jgi:cytosine/adenosine deaminase-related metal-dependent hydrolase
LTLRVGILAAMHYRKFRADHVFDGRKLHSGKVLVTDENGVVEDLVNSEEAGDAEDIKGILTPGFINAHCHLELSHMKGLIPEKTGLVDFVYKVVTERFHPENEILAAIEKAEDEMIADGIVAVGDICNNILTIPQKTRQRLFYRNFIEASGWSPVLSEQRFRRALDIFKLFEKEFSYNSISPHAPYSVSDLLWKLLEEELRGKVVTIHNQETEDENKFFMDGSGDFNRLYEMMKIDSSHHKPTGKTSLQSYFEKLKTAAKIILVHNSFISESDINFIKAFERETKNEKRETFFCICINANQYIESALPPLDLLRKNNADLVIGTDSLASNHSLRITDEIKTIRKFFPAIPLEEILQWATLNGAKALGIDDKFGSFEKGKRPGVVKLDCDGSNPVKIY